EAVTQAARANQLARKAIASARAERAAKVIAEQSKAVAQQALADAEKSAADARDNADKARRAEIKALATQTANHSFREGLTLARTNNSTAAEEKYKEAVIAYQSLAEPDRDGEATTYMELADMYL